MCCSGSRRPCGWAAPVVAWHASPALYIIHGIYCSVYPCLESLVSFFALILTDFDLRWGIFPGGDFRESRRGCQ